MKIRVAVATLEEAKQQHASRKGRRKRSQSPSADTGRRSRSLPRSPTFAPQRKPLQVYLDKTQHTMDGRKEQQPEQTRKRGLVRRYSSSSLPLANLSNSFRRLEDEERDPNDPLVLSSSAPRKLAVRLVSKRRKSRPGDSPSSKGAFFKLSDSNDGAVAGRRWTEGDHVHLKPKILNSPSRMIRSKLSRHELLQSTHGGGKAEESVAPRRKPTKGLSALLREFVDAEATTGSQSPSTGMDNDESESSGVSFDLSETTGMPASNIASGRSYCSRISKSTTSILRRDGPGLRKTSNTPYRLPEKVSINATQKWLF